jgi:hypothetical protein
MAYREGNNEDASEVNVKEENIYDAYKRTAVGEAPIPEAGKEGEPNANDELFTAVLLAQTMDGRVLVISNLDNLKVHHPATPHEMFRMATDAADQIRATRVIGEVLVNTQKMFNEFGRQLVGALLPDQTTPDTKG